MLFKKLIKNKKYLLITLLFIAVIFFAWELSKTFSNTTTDDSWDGVVSTSFTTGSGSLDNPYVIGSASDYAYFKELLEGEEASNYLDKSYIITNSINYSEYDISINNILPFTGTIDGNGNTINSATVTNSIFNIIDNATIKNIKYGNLKVNDTNNILANSINNSSISFVILDGNLETKSEDIYYGISNNLNNSNLNNIVMDINTNENAFNPISENNNDNIIENILVKKGYKISEDYLEYINEFEIIDNNIIIDNIDDYKNDNYSIIINNNSFWLEHNKVEETKSEEEVIVKSPTRSGSISIHDSGIDTNNHAIYINDILSDTNYYVGLNYTKITNTTGVIPTGQDQNIYNSTNLATVYIRYSSADMNNSSVYGSVSVSEDIRDYYYYKKYPVENGYITFDLIDNPWANRPNNMAFNGWVTDYNGAVISLDTDVYVRSVKIPVSSITDPISITFYSNWTYASLATSTDEISTKLKSMTMEEIPGDYGTLTNYYISDHVDYYDYYPTGNGTLYNMSGTRITSSYCSSYYGCDFVRPNTSNVYDSTNSYYTVTPNGNNNATLTRVYPTKTKAISYYNNGDSVAGLFIKVTSGSDNIYSASGSKLTSCGGICYKLLQYSDGTINNNETYYYLPTRDTNIFAPSTTSTISTSNISVSVPMTITGINNGVDNSSNRLIQLNSNWSMSADMRIEHIRFYVSTTSTTVTSFGDGNKIIGNFYNLKIGRGLKRYVYNNNNYLTATSFVGGSTSSASSVTRYSLIVESGFYQNGSAVGYSSAVTHRVLANVILGNDYDRISNNNSNLIVYYCYAGTWASNLYSSSSNSSTYSDPAIYTIVKSGSFGQNKGDYAAGIYVGGRNSGTHYAIREVLVEGGYIYNLLGGPSSASDRASKNDIVINVKGGNIDLVFGGAGASDTVGNKILNITGGTINYGIVGGSNAYTYGTNTTNPNGKIDGDTLLYVGGNVIVGTKNDSLFTISSGDVYGAGNGRVNEPTVGAVNNSNIIIGPTATINGSVYGGGNNGAVGGNTTGTQSGGSSITPTSGGVYEDGTSDNNIRFYGSNPDNYIRFNNENYRIIGLFNNVSTSSGNKNLIRIIKSTSSSSNQTWMSTDNYISTGNNNRDYPNYFVRNNNDQTKSTIYTYLNSTFYTNLNSTYRNYIQAVNWNLGALSSADNPASTFYTAERGNTPGSSYSVTSYNYNIGLFYASDYGYATNNSSCHSRNLSNYSGSSTCYTDNWLKSIVTSGAWTMTPSTAYTNIYRNNNRTYNSYQIFYLNGNNIAGDGVAYRSNSNYYATQHAVYPSFYLKDDLTISSGSGTESDPYIIGNSDNLLTDIITDLLNSPIEEPEVPVIVHEENEYLAKTHIQVLGGTISGSIYGAGNSNGSGNASNNRKALAKVTIDVTGGTVSESIYGGANSEGTVYGDVFINVINGTVNGSVYGGGKGGKDNNTDGTYVTDNVTVNIGSQNTSNLHILGSVYGGSAFGTVNADKNDNTDSYATNVTVNAGVINGSVFGGGQGNSSYTPKVLGNINVTINGGDMTNVFGGNDQAGTHNKSNYVRLNGGTIGSVYGGGNKSSVNNTHVYLEGSTVTSIYGGSNSLGDVLATDVRIKSGSVGTVYGGNNEGGSCGTTTVLVNGTATVSSAIYGGGNQVNTTTTNVNLSSATGTIPNVYGGGNSASVGTTNITQSGVSVTNLFGGSNSTGVVTESNITYNSGTTTNVYGGNNAGGNTVTSNISVTNGTITSLFGGGNNAGLSESNITITNGTITNVYGGSNNSGTVTETNITINNTSSAITAVYGGGNQAEVGTTYVTVNNGTIGNIYGGGNLARVTGNTHIDINGGTINTNVYGGGNFGVVKGSSNVSITNATVLGSAYAGGNGASATLEGNTFITVDGASTIGSTTSVSPTSGCVFGGGNQAYTGTQENNNSTSTVNIVGGTIYGNVYGGANTSVIYGNTNVNIGKDAIYNSNLILSNIHIKGHIFGGGEANASGSEIYDWFFISVTEGTVINIDGEDYNDLTIDGSFYGGGNASSASGDSYLNIKNYGSRNNPQHNISIQRVNYVTIDNSSILLKGAIDRANEYDREFFSISRVNHLKIKNNTELYLETGANLLEKFSSLDSSNNPAAVTIDEENNTLTRTTNNRIYMYEGKNLNIAKDQQVTDYGEVIGMTFLGIFNYDNDRNVNTGIYNNTYNPGDTLDWAGTFSRGSYVLGLHTTNHNIKVNGFYSNFMNEDTTINEVKYIEPTPESARFYMWFIGENVIEYNVNLVASKYSTLGSVEASFVEFSKPNTSFQILSFDSSEIANGVSLIDKNDIPRIASNASDANNKFGLSMESSNSGWLTNGRTSFYTREPSISGETYYEGENSNVVPTMLFYLYHSKNLSEEKSLGTVRISVMAITKINALSNEIKRLVINVNMSSALFQTVEYEGAMTPGDKYELFASTATNITTKSKLSAYYALYGSGTNLYQTGYHRALTSSFVLPVGTKITMLDFINGVPEYYYHVIDNTDYTNALAEFNQEGEASYNLSMFTKMGSKSNNSNYNDALKNSIYYNGTDSSEEFIFIVDYGDTTINSNQLNNTLLIEIRDQNNETIITVLGVQHSQLTYNLYANNDSEIELSATISDNPLYIGYNDIFDVIVNYESSTLNGITITDTQFFDSKLGVQIYLKNSDNNVMSGTDLTGCYYVIDGVRYYPDIDGYTHIKLANKVGNTEKWITFNTENSSLATGNYTFVIEAFASPDGIYYSKGNPVSYNIPISIISSRYGLDPTLNENSVVFSAVNDKSLNFGIHYTSLLNHPNLRVALYRRKYTTAYDTDYEIYDLQDFVSDTLTETNNTYEYLLTNNPSENNTFSLPLNETLETGTYRLAFRLYDNNTLIGEIIRYIIVK